MTYRLFILLAALHFVLPVSEGGVVGRAITACMVTIGDLMHSKEERQVRQANRARNQLARELNLESRLEALRTQDADLGQKLQTELFDLAEFGVDVEPILRQLEGLDEAGRTTFLQDYAQAKKGNTRYDDSLAGQLAKLQFKSALAVPIAVGRLKNLSPEKAQLIDQVMEQALAPELGLGFRISGGQLKLRLVGNPSTVDPARLVTARLALEDAAKGVETDFSQPPDVSLLQQVIRKTTEDPELAAAAEQSLVQQYRDKTKEILGRGNSDSDMQRIQQALQPVATSDFRTMSPRDRLALSMSVSGILRQVAQFEAEVGEGQIRFIAHNARFRLPFEVEGIAARLARVSERSKTSVWRLSHSPDRVYLRELVREFSPELIARQQDPDEFLRAHLQLYSANLVGSP